MSQSVLMEEALTGSIIGAFYQVYNALDFGYLEHIYVLALERELRSRGCRVKREVPVRVFYKGEELGIQRLDMVVDDRVIVEVKSTRLLSPIAKRQLYSYLRSTHLQVGLLLHFGPKADFYRVFCEHVGRRHMEQSGGSGRSV